MPEPPYVVYGTVTGDGSPQESLTVTITNVTLGGSETCTTDSNGHYVYDDLANLPNGYIGGDTIRVSVYSDPLMVYQTFIATEVPEEIEIDLTYFTLDNSDTITLSEALTKDITSILSDSVSLTESLVKGITKVLTDSVSTSDSITNILVCNLTDSVSLSETLTKGITDILSDSISLSATVIPGHVYLIEDDPVGQPNTYQKDAFQGLANSINISDVIDSELGIILTDSITLSDSLSIYFTHSFADTDSIALSDSLVIDLTYPIGQDILVQKDAFQKDAFQGLLNCVVISESLTKSLTMVLTDSISISDVLAAELIYRFYVDISLSKALEIKLHTLRG